MQENTEISHIAPFPHRCMYTVIINNPHQGSALAIFDELKPTYHNQPKSMFVVEFTFGVVHTVGLDKCIMPCTHLMHHREHFY